MDERAIRRRLLLFQLLILLAFGALTAKLWVLQIIGGEDYRALSRQNRIDIQNIDAPRGVIYDRHGRILVRNRPNFRATIEPARVLDEIWQAWGDEEYARAGAALGRIATALEIPFPHDRAADALREALAGASGRMQLEEINAICLAGRLLDCYSEALISAPYEEITIRRDLPRERALVALENGLSLPGLTILSESQREYLYGPLYSHLLGYSLPISQSLLDQQTRFTTNRYLPTDRVGVAGLEQGYEEALRGERGLRLVEENVIGRQIRVAQERDPAPGHNLFLTIETELQRVVAEVLAEGMNGVGSREAVAIVINPKSGELLAMVSLPTYDNNLFVGTIDSERLNELSTDPDRPMFNRAISGVYPPGSTFKIIPAAGALADGVINRSTTLFDPGIIYLPNRFAPDNPELAQPFVCWLDAGHGDENVVEALAHSCDVFFYKVAGGFPDEIGGMGDEALAKWSLAFGLGEPTRIRLPGEASGHVPTRQWKRLAKQESWVTGDTYNMSIGQGDVLVTPLQILNATAAIANGGTIYEPQLVFQVQDADGRVVNAFEPRVLRQVNVPREYIDIVAEGMRGAIDWEDGTARLVFDGLPIEVAGKTGTAEYCAEIVEDEEGRLDCKRDDEGNLFTHAWFTAFAPYDDPEIALVVFVHGNGESVIQGSEVAAPIARRIIDYYFTRRPLDELVIPGPDESQEEGAPERDETDAPAPATASTPIPTSPPKPEPTLAPPPPPAPGGGNYGADLLRSEGQPATLSVVTGRVVNSVGQPQSGVRITLDGGGAPVATLTTAGDGSFRYDLLNAEQAATWYLRAPDLPGAPVLALDVQPNEHYIVLFQEGP